MLNDSFLPINKRKLEMNISYTLSQYKDKEVLFMTVVNDIKTVLAGLKTAQASFETFALSTDNQQAKAMYEDAAVKTQAIVDGVEPRLQEIQQEEPQYRQE